MPHINTFTTSQSVVISIWHLTESYRELVKLWGKERLPRYITQTRSIKRRREILSTHLLIRRYYGRVLEVKHSPNGAPYISKGDKISISHTKEYVAIALHPTRRVGIDIEELDKRTLRVIRRITTFFEYIDLPSAEQILPNGISARFMAAQLTWSIKEAVFKIYPSEPEFKNITLSPFTSLPSGTNLVKLFMLKKEITAYYTFFRNCSLAWAVK